MIQEKAINNVLGYVNGCLLRGVKLEGWKLILKNGLVWLENEGIGVRIRGHMRREDADIPIPDIVLSKSFSAPEFQPVIVEQNSDREKRMERVRRARHAGMFTDRAGTW